MKKLTLLFLFTIICVFAYSQGYKFLNVEERPKDKTVRFSLTGIKDDIHKKELYNKLTANKNIRKFIIDNDNNCEMIILKDFNADYIYNIISPMGINFNTGVLNNDKILNNKVKPPHFPEQTKADGKKVDEQSYQKAIEFWKKRYPEEWEEYKKYNTNIK